MLVGVRNNETQQIDDDDEKNTYILNTIWCCCISEISNSVGRNYNFLAKVRKLSTLPTSLDILDIRQNFIRILYLHIQCS